MTGILSEEPLFRVFDSFWNFSSLILDGGHCDRYPTCIKKDQIWTIYSEKRWSQVEFSDGKLTVPEINCLYPDFCVFTRPSCRVISGFRKNLNFSYLLVDNIFPDWLKLPGHFSKYLVNNYLEIFLKNSDQKLLLNSLQTARNILFSKKYWSKLLWLRRNLIQSIKNEIQCRELLEPNFRLVWLMVR